MSNSSWLDIDIKNLPKKLFLAFVLIYPLISMVVETEPGISRKLFGMFCLGFLFFRIGEIYKSHSSLKVPVYVIFFGLFAVYTLLCGMFLTDYFESRGIKYFYSDPIWLTFIALIVAENSYFSVISMRVGKRILELTLIMAAIVSIIQISNPLFLKNDADFVQGLSVDRMSEYYEDTPEEMIGHSGDMGKVNRFLEGYRQSIFSYINELSIGIDTIAIFSILLAWRPVKLVNTGVVTISAAIVSFLSSSRWIMLNFVVVASQIIWTSKNKLASLLYFVFFSTGVVILVGLIANLMGLDVHRFIFDRLLSNSAYTRFLAFEVFFKVFPDNPIFGTGGADTEKMIILLAGRSSQIHVGFLKLFYYYGLIGGILYLSFMVTFLNRLRKMAKSSGYWGGFYAILAFFIANLTLFELSLFYYGPLLAIIFANHFYLNNRKEKTFPLEQGHIDSMKIEPLPK